MESVPFPGANPACVVRASGVIEAAPETLAALRKQPGLPLGPALPANLLNHAEDQTVVAMAAILRALDQSGWQREAFTDWGVVAAPRFPGRVLFAASMDKFRRLGPLSVSPTIIPFACLHSASSLISLALHIHGPSVGVGGGSDNIVQGFLTGLALAQEEHIPGVWVVLTGWDPEAAPGALVDTPPPVCRAVALALQSTAGAAGATGGRIRLVAGNAAGATVPAGLPDLVRFFADPTATNATRYWGVNRDYTLEWTAPNRSAAMPVRTRSA